MSHPIDVNFKKRFACSVAFALIFSAWVVPLASAHALLVRSVPAANAVLEKPPVQVELYFSEPLEPTLSSISVVDSNIRIVDAGDVRVDSVDPTRMTVTMHALPDGVYTVKAAVHFHLRWGLPAQVQSSLFRRAVRRACHSARCFQSSCFWFRWRLCWGTGFLFG